MPAPRADFTCATCATTYEDLPIASVRCPVCSKKRGFKRLWNGTQVSTKGHRVAQVLDPMMTPQLTAAAMQQDEAKAAAKRLDDDRARAYETSPPEVREAIAQATPGGPVQWLPKVSASSALASLPLEARRSSREDIWPHIKRRVVPTRA